jgi:hypothetical protein
VWRRGAAGVPARRFDPEGREAFLPGSLSLGDVMISCTECEAPIEVPTDAVEGEIIACN